MKSSSTKTIKISLSQEVLDEAKALGMNLSQACEQLLRCAIHAERGRRWAQENVTFFAAYNLAVEQEGLTLASSRSF